MKDEVRLAVEKAYLEQLIGEPIEKERLEEVIGRFDAVASVAIGLGMSSEELNKMAWVEWSDNGG